MNYLFEERKSGILEALYWEMYVIFSSVLKTITASYIYRTSSTHQIWEVLYIHYLTLPKEIFMSYELLLSHYTEQKTEV